MGLRNSRLVGGHLQDGTFQDCWARGVERRFAVFFISLRGSTNMVESPAMASQWLLAFNRCSEPVAGNSGASILNLLVP